MKCPVCNKGKMEKVKDVIKQDGVIFDAFKCNICGEEIITMPQLKVLANKYRKLRESKEVTFAKWGNSIAVRIPRDIVDELQIRSGKQGILTKDKKGIRIIPA
jgi:hypothetical protein